MNASLQSRYEPRIAKLLEEIGSTPTGAPLIDWVRHHLPPIVYGQPMNGAAFTYPPPLRRIVVKNEGDDEWQRELIAHELVHMVRWSGHMVGSLEQEHDAYLTAAKIRSEFNGWDWRKPDPEVVKHYPQLFGAKANKDEFKKALRKRIPFYEVLPWEQPQGLVNSASAMAKQVWFGVRTALGGLKKRVDKNPEEGKASKRS
jgi:hypothetical protein